MTRIRIPGRRLSQPVLISLAPLTNIALALSLEPRLPQLCPETCPQDELKVMNLPLTLWCITNWQKQPIEVESILDFWSVESVALSRKDDRIAPVLRRIFSWWVALFWHLETWLCSPRLDWVETQVESLWPPGKSRECVHFGHKNGGGYWLMDGKTWKNINNT